MRAVARQVASIASVGVVILLVIGNLVGPSNSQDATTTTVAESPHTAELTVISNADCTYAWRLYNDSPDHRAYVLDSDQGSVTVLSVGPKETFIIGNALPWKTLTVELWWWDLANQVYVNNQTITTDATVLAICEEVIATTTTTVPPTTTTSSTLGGGTVPPTSTTTTLAPVTELPFTGPEEGAGIFAAIALVLGGALLYAGNQAHRRYRRSVRVWRR